ncbi:hypothetical protein HRG_004471 [Hirsutella rhossiliensis]|uniref:Uncharacterized protein n=1 Tax=Hirsutella rhossiliensis TaxID=111463 RepID=A0A9P8MXC3_9HYPO|nr:uncharacterized protein HRG_04471 [Hirsutella rhossiliensis]KAH0964043.1 hypothetical protein HRG_04471 [Hirsutella rhossiliensis]
MDASRTATLRAQLRPRALRPIMTSLNGDNSWLMSFPRPVDEAVKAGKAYFHVVFEPWLAGATSVLSSWFIYITLSQPPAVGDVSAIKALIREIEDAARDDSSKDEAGSEDRSETGYRGAIDAILLGFHYLDHLHEATLRTFDKQIPVIATPEAAKILQTWGHFRNIALIHDLPASAKSWRSPELHPGGNLPGWLTPLRLPGHAELNFCLAIIWTHLDEAGVETHEALLNSPHGTRLDAGPLQAFLDAEPATKKLAMLHGLKESHTFGYMTTLGAKGGLALHRKIGGAKYWIPSHHSTLNYAGVFMRLLRTVDTPRTLPWALEEEETGRKGDESCGTGEEPRVVQVENGASLVLEL